MDISVEDLRRHFADLSDEGLLEQRREDLVPAAQACLDEELASRGLLAQVAAAETSLAADDHEDAVVVASFSALPEAEIAQALLEAEGIVATLVHQEASGLPPPAVGGIALAVAAAEAPQARSILEQGLERAMNISDEELAAQAEAAGEAHDATGEPE